MFDLQEACVPSRVRDVHGRLAALMLSVALCACGGGGGGSPAPSPPPAPAPNPSPTLAATAAASAATAGGQPVALHAAASGSSAEPAWTLVGPGSLSASSGADVEYVPPDTESLDDVATATVSVSVPSAPTQQMQIALAPVSLPGRHWTTGRSPEQGWSRIIGFAGAYFAIGPDDHVWRSVDGVAWSSQNVAPSAGNQLAVLGQGDGLMTIYPQGQVYTSADGVAWTFRSQGTLHTPVVGDLVGGNHRFLLSTGLSISVTSDSGVTWATGAAAFRTVAFGNGLFMALDAAGKAWTSPDGVTWASTPDIGTINGLAFAGVDFTALGNGIEAVTDDGSTWISTALPAMTQSARLIAAGSSLFEPVNGSIHVQTSGQAWQDTALETLLATPIDIAFGPAGYVGVNTWGWVLRSDDATTWSTAVEGSFGTLGVVNDFNGLYVVLSDQGWLLTSDDGQHWSHAALGAPSRTQISRSSALAHGNGVIVAGIGADSGSAGDVWVSSDAIAWRHVGGLPAGQAVRTLMFDGKRFLAGDSSGNVYASAAGEGWTLLGNITTSAQVTKIVAGDDGYVAIGTYGLLAWSKDGASWNVSQPVPDVTSFANPAPVATMLDVMWDGHRYLAAGGFTLASSTDGKTWGARQVQGLPINALARCGGIDVAVGYGSVETSADGETWHKRIWSNSPNLSAVSCGRGRVLATGWDGAILVSDH